MTAFDIVIVGGGIAGASLAAALGQGRRVAIIEAEEHCGVHATGRSAAFWLASYGGPSVAGLTRASRDHLSAGWPVAGRSWLQPRGAYHLVSQAGIGGELAEEVFASDEHARLVGREELAGVLPGLSPDWSSAVTEPSCADIDVAGLHQACLLHFRAQGGIIITDAGLQRARRTSRHWLIETASDTIQASIIVNAAGAWADEVAQRCGVEPIGIAPKRRTMVQLRTGQTSLTRLPLIIDARESFYFKGESDRSIWLSPHDEGESDPCDAAPTELDVAIAIDRFQSVVDWPVERVERSWAGLRSFAPDRSPLYGFDSAAPNFFWCAGQGGFGIQTAPAAALLAASLLLGEAPESGVAHINPLPFDPNRFR